MAKTFQLTPVLRIGNLFTMTALRAGLSLGTMSLLTGPGRKSGTPRTTPVAVLELSGNRYIIAAYGVVDWVRNLRAAGGGTLTRGRRSEMIMVVEVSPEEAAPVLKEGVTNGPSIIRPYFDATSTSPLEDFEREAARHPVFQVREVSGLEVRETSDVGRTA